MLIHSFETSWHPLPAVPTKYVRLAREDDLTDIIKVAEKAFPNDPVFTYLGSVNNVSFMNYLPKATDFPTAHTQRYRQLE